MICTFECTFCRDCVDTRLKGVCPNCGGNFAPRPIRPAATLAATRRRRSASSIQPVAMARREPRRNHRAARQPHSNVAPALVSRVATLPKVEPYGAKARFHLTPGITWVNWTCPQSAFPVVLSNPIQK